MSETEQAGCQQPGPITTVGDIKPHQVYQKEFPHDDQLKRELATLCLPELFPYLVWIPYVHFTEIKKLGEDGFAAVYRGVVRSLDPKGFSYLKFDNYVEYVPAYSDPPQKKWGYQ
ncbi:hypothetical protein BC936DRAFT_142277 [Jimgerdemannia flammicorona]|uniref:Uncharacterized protein n=1 Tax=Jimgerdemannia flammicorona TaxID=994334 RepID=A0A433DME6_9FUNG|nr:hypothetical protein BC936DRAFT_142277 [Jimgerdemannia flammicorona]